MPEIEGTPWDGIGFELEIEFSGDRLKGWNVAGQGTLGRFLDRRFIHGVQGRFDRDDDRATSDITALYLAGYRFDEHWSLQAVLGARLPIEEDNNRSSRFIWNLFLLAEIERDRLAAGIEANSEVDATRTDELTLVPQVHYAFSDLFGLQAGLGYTIDAETTKWEAMARLIFTIR